MNLIFKRVVHHFGYGLGAYEAKEMLGLLFEPTEGVPGFVYILSRTTRRPREVLQFTRLAHQNAADQKTRGISTEAISRAEEEFSVWKLEHICSEYLHIYPNLETLLRSFRGRQKRTSRPDFELAILEYQESGNAKDAWVKKEIADILQILYQIEFIGARRLGRSRGLIKELDDFEFFYEAPSPNFNIIDEFLVHPAFWKALELTT